MDQQCIFLSMWLQPFPALWTLGLNVVLHGSLMVAVNAKHSCTVEFSPVTEFYDCRTYVCDASSNGLMLNSSVLTVYNELSLIEIVNQFICASSVTMCVS